MQKLRLQERGCSWPAAPPPSFLLTQLEIFVPEHQGPLVEYGCEVYENGLGDVTRQACPSQQTVWVGNVGDFGAPVVSLVGSGPAFAAPSVGSRTAG
jgi:hypothetical protein